MSKIYTSADQLIGRTPLLELTHIEKVEKLEAKSFRTPTEEQTLKQLKKQKLEGKTKLMELLDSHRAGA